MNYFGLGVFGRPFAHSWPTLRPVAAGSPVLPGWRTAAHGRADQVTTDHLFFRLTLAKLRYSSTRRRKSPGSTYGSNGRVPRAIPNERSANTSEIAPTDLPPYALHGTKQSATTWRNAARVSGGAYVFPSRLPSRCFSSHAGPCSRRSLKLYLVPITELADIGFGSPGLRKRIARLTCPFRLLTTRATSPAV